MSKHKINIIIRCALYINNYKISLDHLINTQITQLKIDRSKKNQTEENKPINIVTMLPNNY